MHQTIIHDIIHLVRHLFPLCLLTDGRDVYKRQDEKGLDDAIGIESVIIRREDGQDHIYEVIPLLPVSKKDVYKRQVNPMGNPTCMMLS